MKQFYSNTFRRITPSSVGRLIELNVFCNFVYRMESSFVNLFLHTLLLCCYGWWWGEWPCWALLFKMVCTVWLGPCSMAGVDFWTLQLCWWTGIEVICTWHPGRSSVVRVRRSVKSGAHGWRWPTQAQLMRSESSKHRCPGQEVSWSLVPLSPRGRWVSMPVSGFSVSHSAGPLA